MTDPIEKNPAEVLIVRSTTHGHAALPLVLIGGHAVPADRVELKWDEDPHPAIIAAGTGLARTRRPRMFVTLICDPSDVEGAEGVVSLTRRPARPHSDPILDDEPGYVDANPEVLNTLAVERSERGVCVAIHGPHHTYRVEVDAREVHALAAELLARLGEKP